MSDSERVDFMTDNGIKFEQLSSAEKRELQDKLVNLSKVSEVSFEATKYFKIPFQQALPLVSSREVYLSGGMAFVPLTRLVATIVIRVRQSVLNPLLSNLIYRTACNQLTDY
jgi:DNA primase large subunit